MNTTRTRGFTLLELLVVVAIIGTLAALLLPVLGRAQALAQRSACGSNLRQWGVALQLFLDDNAEFLPRENAVDDINSWYLANTATNNDVWYNALPLQMGQQPLAAYAAIAADQMEFYSPRSLFHCPTAKAGSSPLAATYPNFSLAMNSKLIVSNAVSIKTAAILDPSRTPFFIDCGVPGEQPLPGQKPYNGQPHAFASRFSARHNGFGNLWMADGHLDSLPAFKVVDMNPAHTNSYGKSIFPPVDVVWRSDPRDNPNK